jgi:hypothetical protein
VIGRLNWIESEMKAWDVKQDVVQIVENSIHQLPVSSKAGHPSPTLPPNVFPSF